MTGPVVSTYLEPGAHAPTAVRASEPGTAAPWMLVLAASPANADTDPEVLAEQLAAVADALATTLSDEPEVTLPDAVHAASTTTATADPEARDEDTQSTPISLAMVRTSTTGAVDCYALGTRATVLVTAGGMTHAITDPRPPLASVPDHGVELRIPVGRLSRVAVASAGAVSLHTRHGQRSPAELLDMLEHVGPEYLAFCTQGARAKAAPDVAALDEPVALAFCSYRHLDNPTRPAEPPPTAPFGHPGGEPASGPQVTPAQAQARIDELTTTLRSRPTALPVWTGIVAELARAHSALGQGRTDSLADQHTRVAQLLTLAVSALCRNTKLGRSTPISSLPQVPVNLAEQHAEVLAEITRAASRSALAVAVGALAVHAHAHAHDNAARYGPGAAVAELARSLRGVGDDPAVLSARTPELVSRLVGCARTVTGQPEQAALSRLRPAVSDLDPEQRRQITAALLLGPGGWMCEQPPAVADPLRRLVVRDTTTPAQQELETAVLTNLGDLEVSVAPRDGLMALSGPVPQLAQLVVRLLPHQDGQRQRGIPGLRLATDYGLLHHAGHDSDKVGILLATTAQQWRECLTAVRSMAGAGEIDAPGDTDTVGSAGAGMPFGVASAVLRRSRLLGACRRLDVAWDSDTRVFAVTWAGGRPAASVVWWLLHPLATLSGGVRSVSAHGDALDLTTTFDGAPVVLRLRRVPADHSPRPTTDPSPDTPSATPPGTEHES